MILAGYNILTKKPTLNWIDELGTRASVPYCAHGYGAYYTMSIFDRYHRDDISYEEGIDIIQKCISELDKRLPISSGGYLYRSALFRTDGQGQDCRCKGDQGCFGFT